MKKVLMTFMESGMGHIVSIESISDSFKALYGDEFEVIDSYIMRESDRPCVKRFEDFIIKQTKNTNRVKGFGNFVFFIMNLLGKQRLMRFFQRVICPRALKGTLEVFDKYKPDAIVSTHYYMTFCALEYKKKYNHDVKVITYNPDNNVHPWWDNRDHLFLVNNQDAYFDAIGKQKFSPERVHQVYYTARNEIIECNATKVELREKYNIPLDKFCVIVADGIYACGKSKQVTNHLLNTDKPLTVIMLAGKNKKVYDYFVEKEKTVKPNITLITLPFTQKAYEYYRASDLFITKAGPNAVLDSVFMNTPIIVDYFAHPIEKATTKLFIDTYGCGKAIFEPKKIVSQVEEWIEKPELLESYVENTKKIDKNKNGGVEAAKLIYEEINTNAVYVSKDEYVNRLYTLAGEGKYDAYTTPINLKNAQKLDNNYVYDPHGILFKIYRGIVKSVIRFLGPLVNFVGFHIEIHGKSNLKGVKNGITISNHVHYLDSLWNMQTMRNKKFYITGAEHNSKKGFFGATLKAGGFLPMSDSFSNNKKFSECVQSILSDGGFVHFYPEQSLWYEYTQSRPLKKERSITRQKMTFLLFRWYFVLEQKARGYSNTR